MKIFPGREFPASTAKVAPGEALKTEAAPQAAAVDAPKGPGRPKTVTLGKKPEDGDKKPDALF